MRSYLYLLGFFSVFIITIISQVLESSIETTVGAFTMLIIAVVYFVGREIYDKINKQTEEIALLRGQVADLVKEMQNK